jgi:CheY-like chemotaxis protein
MEGKKSILFIDDSPLILRTFERLFGHIENVYFAECHSADEALSEINKINPQIVFLDHSLSNSNGNEGLMIVDKISGSRTIYSTTETTDPEILTEYEKRGIQCIGKRIEKLKRIIESLNDL